MSVSVPEERRIIAALRQVGMEVTSVYDLVNARYDYRQAIPVLVDLLQEGIHDQRTKEGVIRALGVKEAKGIAARPLLEEFQRTSRTNDDLLKWAIANALSVVADDSVLEDVIRLVQDRRHGKSREMLAVALGNMKAPRAVDVLVDLLDDEEVTGHALMALRKLRAQKAKPQIERFVNHPKSWIKKAASRALAEFGNK